MVLIQNYQEQHNNRLPHITVICERSESQGHRDGDTGAQRPELASVREQSRDRLCNSTDLLNSASEERLDGSPSVPSLTLAGPEMQELGDGC